MGELESVLDEMEEQDLASLPDAIVEEGFARLQRSAERLELLRLRQLAELDLRRPYVRDGYLSLSSWVAHQHRVAYCTATSDVRRAQALEAMPKTREALVAGEISCSAARVLASARETDHDAFGQAEHVGGSGGAPLRPGPGQGGGPLAQRGWNRGGTIPPERIPCGSGAGCTSRRRCSGWSASTGTSIQTPGRPCSRSRHRGDRAHRATQLRGRRLPVSGPAGSAIPRPAPGRRPGRDLPAVAGLLGSAAGRRGAAPRDRDRGA